MTATNASTSASASASASPLSLSPGGEREAVSKEQAAELVHKWTEQLLAHQALHPTLTPLCNKIDLSDKSYTEEAALLIADFLTSERTFSPCIANGIEVADYSDMIAGRMTEEGFQVLNILSSVFANNTCLIDIDLSENALGFKGIKMCEKALVEKASLERLSLCNNGLSWESMKDIADILTAEFASNSDSCIAQNLTKLHFYNNMSGPQGSEQFERIMDRCSDKLTDIRYSSTRAGHEGSTYITRALCKLGEARKLENVTHLDLADNEFLNCSTDLVSILASCPKLEYLNFKYSALADSDSEKSCVEDICNALVQSNAPLKYLNLSGNEIEIDDVKPITNLAIKVAGTLETLDLEENILKSVGVKRILRKLESTSLKKVLLNETECGDIGAKAVIEMMEKIPNLESIELDRNNFSDDMVDQLKEAFGDKLVEFEDNYGEDDEDEDDEDTEEVEEIEDGLEALTAAMSTTGI